jgi:hypothetical protein
VQIRNEPLKTIFEVLTTSAVHGRRLTWFAASGHVDRRCLVSRGLRWPLVGLLAAMCLSAGDFVWCDETSGVVAAEGPEGNQLEQQVGKTVTVHLRSGRHWEDAELVRIDRHGQTNEILRLRLRLADDTKKNLGIQAVQRVEAAGRPVYEAPSSQPKAEAATPGDGKKSRSRRQRRTRRPAPLTPEQLRAQQEEQRRWLGRLRARGIQPWKPESKGAHQAALERYHKMIQQVSQTFPNVQLYETQHFLFCSNMPTEEATSYAQVLDSMFDWMCEIYGVAPGTPVWLGKAPVFAFNTQMEFQAFERQFYQANIGAASAGLCHSSSRGDVVISCYRRDNPDDFGHMLVHETSHGFIHRYKTKVSLPTWVNEGMAEFIGAKMVPHSNAIKNKETVALARLKEQGNLGQGFFNPKERLKPWQYGVASSMARFMITSHKENYVQFIEALKEGMPWEEALSRTYGVSPQELVAKYGMWFGVPNLTP